MMNFKGLLWLSLCLLICLIKILRSLWLQYYCACGIYIQQLVVVYNILYHVQKIVTINVSKQVVRRNILLLF